LNANPRLKEFFTNYVSENSPGSASDWIALALWRSLEKRSNLRLAKNDLS
jgi:hypothetical protein